MKRRFEKRPYWERPLDLFKLCLTLGGILALGLGWLNGCVSAPAAPTFEPPTLVAGTKAFVNGLGTPGSIIHLYRNGLDVGTAQVNANGKWQITLPEAVAGEYSLLARASANLADVESKPITVQVVAAGAVANAPLILTPLGGTLFAPDGQFGEINGKALPNMAVAIYDGDTKLGETTANVSGSWAMTLPTLGLGAHALTARMTQADGIVINSWPVNVVVEPGQTRAGASQVVVNPTTTAVVAAVEEVATVAVATVAIATPEIAATTAVSAQVSAATATVISTPAIATPIAQPTVAAPAALAAPAFAASVQGLIVATNQTNSVSGSAAPNSTVLVFAGAQKLGTTKTDVRGNWVLPVAGLAAGKYVLTLRDENGKSGVAQTNITVVAPPAAPAITNISNGQRVSAQAPTEIAGTAPAASTVEVFAGDVKIGEAKANARGKWKLETTEPLAVGKQVLRAVAQTADGIRSEDSQPVDVESTLTPLLPTTGGAP